MSKSDIELNKEVARDKKNAYASAYHKANRDKIKEKKRAYGKAYREELKKFVDGHNLSQPTTV